MSSLTQVNWSCATQDHMLVGLREYQHTQSLTYFSGKLENDMTPHPTVIRLTPLETPV